MSLRGRLFLIVLVVNLGLLGFVQLAGYEMQLRWLEANRKHYESEVYEDTLRYAYRDALSEDPDVATETVRRVLDPGLKSKWQLYFRDVLITSGTSAQAAVDLNPMGALARDPETFPLDLIRAGIQTARAERRLVQVWATSQSQAGTSGSLRETRV